MQNELDTLQNEIDDLVRPTLHVDSVSLDSLSLLYLTTQELQLMTQKSAPAARAASRARIQATRNR